MQIKRDFSVKNIGSYPMTMNKARRQVGIAGKERRRRTRGRMVRTQRADRRGLNRLCPSQTEAGNQIAL